MTTRLNQITVPKHSVTVEWKPLPYE
jgi:hypothetical protein